MQDCFNMRESQGMLAMHPCALSSLDQPLRGMQNQVVIASLVLERKQQTACICAL